MENLLAKVRGGKVSNEILYNLLLQTYSSVCGNYGKSIFERNVLPQVFKRFGRDKILLTEEALKIIEHAGDLPPSRINRYLSGIYLDNGNKQQKSLERDVRKLEGLLIIYNEGK